jgi:thiol-disulfide isomerase/thioredoxin
LKSLLLKFSVIFLIFGLTFGYSSWWKSRALHSDADFLILKRIPEFSVDTFYKRKKITTADIIGRKSKEIFIHFWATWCGPCETELPDFISFAIKDENRDKLFLIIAVNDNPKNIKKFLKKIAVELPENIILGLDDTGVARNGFGTVKVPETYLFDKNGRALRKFIGVQRWN